MVLTGQVENKGPGRVSAISQVELFARLAGGGLFVIYALGFLILSLHGAKFGISQFNPFRAKIFAAGFVFACLTALPGAAMYFGLSYYGGLEPVVESTDKRIAKYRNVVLLLAFLYTAWLMAYFSKFLFVPTASTGRPLWISVLSFAVAVVFFAVSYSVVASHLIERPKSCIFLAILATIFVVLVFEFFGDKTSATLTLWFFGIGFFVFVARESENRLRYALDWRNWLFAAVLIGLYASTIYGRMLPQYGGGAPAPVVLYLNQVSGWLDCRTVGVSLLDENEEGYFILPPNSGKALFIPRSNVAAVFFGTLDEVPKKK